MKLQHRPKSTILETIFKVYLFIKVTVSTCPSSWTLNRASETCMKFQNGPKNWNEARAECRRNGGDLMKIPNAETNAAVYEYIETKTSSDVRVWLGLHGKQDGHWYWLDDSRDANFFAWGPSQPNQGSIHGTCTSMNFWGDEDWADDLCTMEFHFLCEQFQEECGTTSNPKEWCPKECSDQCEKKDTGTTSCEIKTGACFFGCKKGFHGDKCSSACSHNCGAPNKACDNANGTCIDGCVPGYLGSMCNISCPVRTFGDQCAQTCHNCGGANKTCDNANGTCFDRCEPGYLGSMCDIPCNNSKYGVNCLESCSPFCAGSNKSCSPINGMCTSGCMPGFQGDKCNARVISATTSYVIAAIAIFMASIAAFALIGILRLLAMAKRASEGEGEDTKTVDDQSKEKSNAEVKTEDDTLVPPETPVSHDEEPSVIELTQVSESELARATSTTQS